MSGQNYVKCSISKIIEYQRMLSRSRTDLLKSIDLMENAIKKVSQSWQDDVFMSIRIPLQKSDAKLQSELESLKIQVMKRLEVQERWLMEYKKTTR